MSNTSIDLLTPKRSLIDLSAPPDGSFDSAILGYSLSKLMEDVILVRYKDESEDGKSIKRNGILIPLNSDTKAWRIGEVLLVGAKCEYVKVGDHVCFPNNLGVPIANIDVDDVGKLKKGIFLNESRIFGIVKPNDNK
jgi:co-chaperonin GroES (HSP10)